MKYFNIPAEGTELAFDKQDLKWLQEGLQEAINGLLTLLGDGNYILSGVVVSGASVSAGWIYYEGKLLRFEAGGASTDYFMIYTSTNEEGDYEEYAAPGTGSEQVALSNLVRVDNISNRINGGSITYNSDGIKTIPNYINYITVSYAGSTTYPGTPITLNLPDSSLHRGMLFYFRIKTTSMPFLATIKTSSVIVAEIEAGYSDYSEAIIANIAGHYVLLKKEEV